MKNQRAYEVLSRSWFWTHQEALCLWSRVSVHASAAAAHGHAKPACANSDWCTWNYTVGNRHDMMHACMSVGKKNADLRPRGHFLNLLWALLMAAASSSALLSLSLSWQLFSWQLLQGHLQMQWQFLACSVCNIDLSCNWHRGPHWQWLSLLKCASIC